VVNKAPNEPLPILERAFLQFILSDEGQAMVSENGYYPINQELKVSQLRKLAN
jgi:phosphate transport system substrate-binding protein